MTVGSVLILGGTGYLGQFAVLDFANKGWQVLTYHNTQKKRKKQITPPSTNAPTTSSPPFLTQVTYTHHSTRAPKFPTSTPGTIKDFWVNLSTGEGLIDCLASLPTIDLIINCAAISQPALCEKDISLARSVNVPTKLIDHLIAWYNTTSSSNNNSNQQSSFFPKLKPPLLIQLSTDQVYDGTHSWWKEDHPTHPVNAYGQIKLEAEQLIQSQWKDHAILRSSIIYGPQPPATTVSRALFLQFVDTALREKRATTFFNDEWRCPVYVDDIVATCHTLASIHLSNSNYDNNGSRYISTSTAPSQAQSSSSTTTMTGFQHRVFNLGGPERLSRVDMAKIVAEMRDYNGDNSSIIVEASAASADRGAASPSDISMDCSRIREELGLEMMSFREGLKKSFHL